jgi:hypothetical protein
MDPKFAALVENAGTEARPSNLDEAAGIWALPRDMPKSGVYLFTEVGRHLYVGRSNVLRGRHGRHCRPGATHRQAAFAFQLAREATGRTAVSHRAGEGSRAGLMLDPVFAAAFAAAKQRIRGMEYPTWKRQTKIGRPYSKSTAPSFWRRTILAHTDRPSPHASHGRLRPESITASQLRR